MPLVRWRNREWGPFRELVRLQDEMDRIFGGALAHRHRPMDLSLAPAIDVYSEKDHLKVKAELPGVKKEDIEVNLTGNVLTIRGSKKEEQTVKEEGYHYHERSFGEFERSVELPARVDANKIEARFADGVLEVTLPLHEEVKPKQIEVKVS